MYHHVRGTLFRLAPTEAIVEAGGVGYAVEIAFPVYQALEGRLGSEVHLFVFPLFREESQRLFGFLSEKDREFFRLILSVRGFGPSHALALLSGLPLGELHQAITGNMPEVLQRVRGIGRKNAERLIVELREKLPAAEPVRGEPDDAGETARLALQGLGYSRLEAVSAIDKAKKADPGAGAAEWIRHALQSRS
jgi:Holliday junction DNA helicase RuvA